jgi:hypothetical protein
LLEVQARKAARYLATSQQREVESLPDGGDAADQVKSRSSDGAAD